MKFATITEGASEHRVIKHLLSRYFRDEDPIINAVQPKLAQGKQQNPGGWVEVIKYCGRPEIRDILVENDFLIIQIDTDQSEKRPFDVRHTDVAGQVIPAETLMETVRQKLISLLIPEIASEFLPRIIFAICIHTVECWLLPAIVEQKDFRKTSNCIDLLNPALRRKSKGKVAIPSKDKNSPTAIRAYEFVLADMRSRKEIAAAASFNPGFRDFINSLERIEA